MSATTVVPFIYYEDISANLSVLLGVYINAEAIAEIISFKI